MNREKICIIPDHVVNCQQWLEVMAAVSYPSSFLLHPHCLQVEVLPRCKEGMDMSAPISPRMYKADAGVISAIVVRWRIMLAYFWL